MGINVMDFTSVSWLQKSPSSWLHCGSTVELDCFLSVFLSAFVFVTLEPFHIEQHANECFNNMNIHGSSLGDCRILVYCFKPARQLFPPFQDTGYLELLIFNL